ncbi:hypothetical protein GCM10009832_24950 [Dietzia kunjamensis subsp. schimae]
MLLCDGGVDFACGRASVPAGAAGGRVSGGAVEGGQVRSGGAGGSRGGDLIERAPHRWCRRHRTQDAGLVAHESGTPMTPVDTPNDAGGHPQSRPLSRLGVPLARRYS